MHPRVAQNTSKHIKMHQTTLKHIKTHQIASKHNKTYHASEIFSDQNNQFMVMFGLWYCLVYDDDDDDDTNVCRLDESFCDKIFKKSGASVCIIVYHCVSWCGMCDKDSCASSTAAAAILKKNIKKYLKISSTAAATIFKNI